MHEELVRGAALTLDPVAWENTMAALEWVVGDVAVERRPGLHVVTEEDLAMLRRIRALGSTALAGGPRSPALPGLIERFLVAFYGRDWAAIADWPSTLEALRRRREGARQADDRGDRGASHDFEPRMWMAEACSQGAACLYVLFRALERGAADLPIDPVAWDNTMTVLAWTARELSAGRAQIGRTITAVDVERIHRLRALGAQAISGGERSAELLPLVEQCLVAFHGPDWRRDIREPGQGYPPTYLHAGSRSPGTNQHSSPVES
ncbi:MAG: hypothetical protein QM820_27255 [Minicystis sp.]